MSANYYGDSGSDPLFPEVDPDEGPIESWRKVLRDGWFPTLKYNQLKTLEEALKENDLTLIQGATCSPPTLQNCGFLPCKAACLLAYIGWKDEYQPLETVGEVEKYFGHKCHEITLKTGVEDACKYLLNWFDDTPRMEMIDQLLSEVQRELQRRNHGENS